MQLKMEPNGTERNLVELIGTERKRTELRMELRMELNGTEWKTHGTEWN